MIHLDLLLLNLLTEKLKRSRKRGLIFKLTLSLCFSSSIVLVLVLLVNEISLNLFIYVLALKELAYEQRKYVLYFKRRKVLIVLLLFRPSAIPGPAPDEIVLPASSSIGNYFVPIICFLF